MNKKKIAILGLGKIGLFHLSILTNIKEVEVVGLIDPQPSSQKTVNGMGFQIPFYANLDELFSKNKPDGVFICVPPAYNAALSQKCLENNVSVFLEKPMTAQLKDAINLNKIIESKTITHAVGYMVAYYPVFQQVKKLIIQNAIGDIKHYSSSLLLGEVFKKQEGWRQDPKISGGGVIPIVGSHLLFLLQDWFGMPEKVQARCIHLFSQVEDICQAEFYHKKGFSGEYSVSWSRPGYNEMSFQIYIEGTHGFLEISENRLALYSFDQNSCYPEGWKIWNLWDLPQLSSSLKIQFNQQGYAAQDLDFIESIGTKHQPLASWHEGLNVQKLIETLYQSHSESGALLSIV